MSYTDHDFAEDIERIQRIPMIPTLLDVICQTTGMGFAAVARVTEDRWVACCVRDDIRFGLVPGGELSVTTTICNEIRDSHQPVVIDHVRESTTFCTHPTPLMYGFQSYISFPIFLKSGGFFGTLCAIDTKPAQLENTKITGLFGLFTDLISFHLQQLELLEQNQRTLTNQMLTNQQLEESETRYRTLAGQLEDQVQQRTRELQEGMHTLKRANENLETFAYIASHDLQEPLRKIQSFGTMLMEKYADSLGDDVDLLNRMQLAASRMSELIRDLLAYSRLATQRENQIPVSLDSIVERVVSSLELTIKEKNAQITLSPLPIVQGERTQLTQLFQNLFSNALKYSRPEAIPYIQLNASLLAASDLPERIKPSHETETYHQIEVRDNGIGFNERYLDRIFQVFQRLHARNQYGGTGIGLAICEKVVNNHGGAITASSKLGEGSTFYVYLPA